MWRLRYTTQFAEIAMTRTNNEINLRLVDWSRIGESEMPIIRRSGTTPLKLTAFNSARAERKPCGGVHFFIDDYQFERVWRNPSAYVNMLGRFQCALSPDFSLFVDMPEPMKIWNVFRNRLLGSWWQKNGIDVIPSVSWADPDSFRYCFAGIEPNGVVAVSTIGSGRSGRTRSLWGMGAEEMVRRLQPHTVLVYGEGIQFDHGGAEVITFKNTGIDRLRRIGNGR